MSIVHDSYVFDGIHGVMQEGKPEAQIQVSTYPGVFGASVMVGANGGTDLWTTYYIDGFNTRQLLHDKLKEIHEQTTRLTGTVTVIGPGSVTLITLPKCTFRGFDVSEVRLDGSGRNGYFARGRLSWLFRNPRA